MAVGRHRPSLSDRNRQYLIPLQPYDAQESANTPEPEAISICNFYNSNPNLLTLQIHSYGLSICVHLKARC